MCRLRTAESRDFPVAWPASAIQARARTGTGACRPPPRRPAWWVPKDQPAGDPPPGRLNGSAVRGAALAGGAALRTPARGRGLAAPWTGGGERTAAAPPVGYRVCRTAGAPPCASTGPARPARGRGREPGGCQTVCREPAQRLSARSSPWLKPEISQAFPDERDDPGPAHRAGARRVRGHARPAPAPAPRQPDQAPARVRRGDPADTA